MQRAAQSSCMGRKKQLNINTPYLQVQCDYVLFNIPTPVRLRELFFDLQIVMEYEYRISVFLDKENGLLKVVWREKG